MLSFGLKVAPAWGEMRRRLRGEGVRQSQKMLGIWRHCLSSALKPARLLPPSIFPPPHPVIKSIIVLGGGSAGLIAALTLKRRLPQLTVRVIRSPEIGIIGVGEGTTVNFPKHFFQYLGLNPKSFYAEAEPTWKLGIRFLWGPRDDFFYTFSTEHDYRYSDLPRNAGFYQDDATRWLGRTSALMAFDKAFYRGAGGLPDFTQSHGFHIENIKLVGWLERTCRALGVHITEGTMREAEREGEGIAALQLESGERVTADLFVDASGFRSELLGRTLAEPYISFDKSLFCDRAVIAGWPRTDEPIRPYTVAETMDAGWCWQIEHENWINRGYVYSSRFISDDAALAEFRAKNPKIANEPRVVKFRSGRLQRGWVGNVVAIGNASGFVEPLEATALQVIALQSQTLADGLLDSEQDPGRTVIGLYNDHNASQWDDTRDFLAIHYAYNTRLDTPFWEACRRDTDIGGAARMVEYYRENGPSTLGKFFLLGPTNSFQVDGYLALLCGQKLPHGHPHTPSAKEAGVWKARVAALGSDAAGALSVKQALEAIRSPKWKW